ncbi:MAG: hypothetical protein WA958_02070 [Tunicatimonas sp.]
MKIKMTSLRPNFSTFLKHLLLTATAVFIVGAVIQIFMSMNSFEPNFHNWWLYLVFLAIGVSVGVTFGARRSQLILTDTIDVKKIKAWTLKFFSEHGLSSRENNDDGMTLESTNRFNRLFNNWFGTELISVKQVDNEVIIEGPIRHIDSIDLKLKFSKSLN